MSGSGFCGSGIGWGMGHGPGMLLVLVLVIVTMAIVLSRAHRTRPEKNVHRGDEALELLRRRYAAGELSEEDFQGRKNNLQA
ncbi:MAG: SHOCT domain-containing protein [Desulfobulbaceae bacterium]|nr:SHOCT domain-containing protein [Desulfobulbaceae bacterium]